MVRFQCPHCQGIVASEVWEPGVATVCAYCSKEVKMPEERLSPGAVIGDFMLVRKLGAGGMGIVYLAHQLSLDRPAAIKILNSEFSHEAESVQAFIREARSAAKINHPNIVQAYAVGEEDGIFYFAMEFLDGETMKEELQKLGKIEPRKAADVIMQVAQALECAWREQKLIHRDIKPDNIMMCANDRVKLADLGLSGTFGDDADDDSDEVVGTPQYISPEQLTGVVTDTRSDIYSLGATFYHLVTGQFPYNGENTEEIAKQHVFGTLVPPRQINPMLPQALDNIIVKMMAKKPENRYQDCSALIKDLKDFLENRNQSGGGLTGGLNSGMNSGKGEPSGGLKLNSNGGGMTIQPKLAASANPVKISIKGADKSEEKNEDKSDKTDNAGDNSAADNAQGSAAKPAPIKLNIAGAQADKPAAPSIKLSIPQSEDKKSADAAQETPEPPMPETPAAPPAPSAPAPAPKITLRRPGGDKKAPVPPPAPAPAASAEAADKSDEAAKAAAEKENYAVDESKNNGKAASAAADGKQDEKTTEAAEGKAAEGEAGDEKATDEKSAGKKSRLPLIIAAVAVLAIAGAGVWWFLLRTPEAPAKQAPTGDNRTLAEKMLAESEAAAREAAARDASKARAEAEAARKAQAAAQAAEAKPKAEVQLSEFMRQAEELETMRLDDERSFVSRWPYVYASLRPADSAEQKVMDALQAAYIEADERLNVAPVRSSLRRSYDALLARQAKDAEQAAYLARIKAIEDAAFKKAESSAEKYHADLPRKMSILDHAMISAAKSGNAADWSRLEAVVALAMAEPERVAARQEFQKDALALAEYARRIKFAAEQGRYFTDMLKKGALNDREVTVRKMTVKVLSSSLSKIQLSVTEQINVEESTERNENLNLLKGSLVKNKKWIDIVEPAGRSDLYFYYMLYNGNLQQRLSDIAPDAYWQKRVDRIARGYFKRCLLLARPQELELLKQQFGSQKSFQNALKEFEAEQQ